jgi:hypothetical protein
MQGVKKSGEATEQAHVSRKESGHHARRRGPDEVEERCAASRDDKFKREHILQGHIGQGEERSAARVPLHEKVMNYQGVNGVGRVKIMTTEHRI